MSKKIKKEQGEPKFKKKEKIFLIYDFFTREYLELCRLMLKMQIFRCIIAAFMSQRNYVKCLIRYTEYFFF